MWYRFLSFLERNSRTIELLFVFTGLVVLFFCLPHFVSGDGYLRFRVLRRLVHAGKMAATAHSMVGPLFALPLWPLGKLFQSPEWWVARFNFFLFAGGIFVFYRILRDQLDPGVVRKFLLILMFGSMFPNHLMDFYGEVFTALLVGTAILATQLGRPRWGWGGMVVGALNTPASLVGLGGVAAAESVKRRRLRYLLVPVVAGALYLLESWIRRGSPFATGYEGNAGAETLLTYSGRPGFSYPLFFGLLSVLLSFGKGLLFFAPGLLLSFQKHMAALKSELRSSYRLWMWFLVGLVLVYAKWWAWYGGWTWGPRFFLFASIPASFALAVSLARANPSIGRSLLVLTLLGLSFWVGVSGGVFGLEHLEDCRDPQWELLCWYVPEFSVLWRPFVIREPLGAGETILLLYGVLVFAYLAMPIGYDLGLALQRKFWLLKAQYMDWRKWEI
jgi:hypothetical protein